MFTTRSRSGNSKRCGVSASRSLGPMSESVLIIVNTLSITSLNSREELNSATSRTLMGTGAPREGSDENAPPLHQVLVHLALDHAADHVRDLEHCGPVGSRLGAERREIERLAELDPPA